MHDLPRRRVVSADAAGTETGEIKTRGDVRIHVNRLSTSSSSSTASITLFSFFSSAWIRSSSAAVLIAGASLSTSTLV